MDQDYNRKREANPREKAGILSILSFFYTFSLFKKGYRRPLDEKDVYDIRPIFSSKRLGDYIEDYWINNNTKKKPLTLTNLIWISYGRCYLLLGLLPFVMKTTTLLVQPRALGKLISYFTVNQTTISKDDAIYYGFTLIVLGVINCIFAHNYMQIIIEFSMKIRTSFTSLIYRKALRLSPQSLSEIPLGNIVTLITKDVSTMDSAFIFMNDIWIGFIQTCITCYLIYDKIGWPVFVGVAFLFLIIPLQLIIGKQISKSRFIAAKKTDIRTQTTQETLSAIKIIKMYTWEKSFKDYISLERKEEIEFLRKIYYFKGLTLLLGALSSSLAFYILIMTYVTLGNNIDAEKVYFIIACFTNLRSFITITIPLGISQTADLLASLRRISKVLNAEEIEKLPKNIVATPRIYINKIAVQFSKLEILKNVSMKIEEKGLYIVTGPVGCGKSTLLKTILGEFKVTQGKIDIQGTISYTPQEPWMFPSSIKQNILFGQPYDEKRYWKVLSVCALTYDLNLLDDGDNTIVGDNGINLSKGQKARINLARACYKESDIYLLDDCLTALDAKVNKYVFNECIKGFLRDKIVVFVSHNVHHIKQADHTVIIDEGSTLNIQRQKDLLEKRITYYIDDVEENHFEGEKDIITDNETDKLLIEQQNKTAKNIYQEQSASGTVKCGTYKKYYEFSGGIFALIWTFVLFFGAQGASSYSEMLLSKWVNLEAEIASFRNKNISTETNSTYASKVSEHDEIQKWYSIMIIVVSVLMFLRIYFCFLYCTYASHRLHNTMLHSILHSCMAFFDTNFIGNILNRFTKDLAAIDEYLPYLVYENFKLVFVIGGIIFLIASVNKAFLIPAAVIFVILYFIRKFYLNTGRSLKRLEATTRSPMIGYLNASLDGLTTIRAYELEPTIRKEFDRHLDLFTSAFYMLLCATRAFGFILDMICTLFITTIILKFLYSENDASAGNVGMAITQSFMLTGLFQWAIRQWAELESSMTSVERVLEYTSLKAENKTGLTYDNWPTHGGIVYENVNLVYTTTKEHVLKDINFIIKPREKIGIVGRTGAGKSSIISTLFRLYDIEGKILIDDVDIKTVSLDFLRSNIAIIPQDPILFSGSIRSNIDPTGKNTDMEIWKAIQTVKLNTLVNTLDQSISDSGTQYSAGQRQLICLARALVTRNKIIVLDEATANMDPETDQLLHNSLKENFSDCTVLTIAHRLNSVINSDRVMVVDDGRIVEFDRPDVLLADNSGAFYQVAKQAGIV